ncbi:hypothetical protein JZK55_01210 [Dissulfurispira thermophila]|uniref:Uncharacterized protein n=1 Tax=Dissulfurispira thermophila TaxID=2715679 RepID=A0A7G1GYY3_9BACT|nr:hypothetical protein [Dissulfurispira thermophila]BCB95199.1 hypothetical protein JZK55_01210 [Dissulfurispira thermophila]
MIAVAQLKNLLADKIYEIEDKEFLNAIKKILDTVSQSERIYRVSDEQKTMILQGKEQIAGGKYIANEELKKEEDVWLNE